MHFKDMDNKFEKLIGFLKRSHDRLFFAYSHFQIWEELMELKAPNVAGNEIAKQNVETMTKYNCFFALTLDAHRRVFAIELAKFFDLNADSLSIKKIIEFARSNRKDLTVQSFVDFNAKRPNIDELRKNYIEIEEKDLKALQEDLKKLGLDIAVIDAKKKIVANSLIWKLKKFRDQELAHDQIKKDINLLSVVEIQEMFNSAEKILNTLSGKLNHETWWHFGADNNKHHTRLVVDHLRRFEPYRLKEIDDSVNEDLSKYILSNSK